MYIQPLNNDKRLCIVQMFLKQLCLQKMNNERNCQRKVFPVVGVLQKQVTGCAMLLSNDRTTIGGQPLMYILRHIKYDTGCQSIMYM